MALRFLRLSGSESLHSQAPQACQACGCKKLYVQSDFNRNIGLWLVGIASALTVLFAYQGYNWFLTWSPMLAFLIMDRGFAMTSPPVVICYKCEHLHRGLSREVAEGFPPFDLDEHDRILYAERVDSQT